MSLKENESKSIYMIREAYRRFNKPALLWSIGKDSTTLLWLIRKAFFNKVPFPVVHINTQKKFKEIYEFRSKYKKIWNLDLKIAQIKNPKYGPKGSKFNCCNERKTEALKQLLKKEKYDGLFCGIRRDEHGIRNKERFFSPRDINFHWHVAKEKIGGDAPFESQQDTELSGWSLFGTDFKDASHVRVHPLLHWTELEIWQYIKQENIPIVDLYFSKRGKRYRSIGCECCCSPIKSDASTIDEIIEELRTTKIKERDGRSQDKENAENMQSLRCLGYL